MSVSILKQQVDMIYTLYKTTSLINDKYYIGVHGTIDPHDKYLGSGIRIKRSVRKYGKENFRKFILEIFERKEDAYQAEKEYITKDILNDSLCLNLKGGGKGANSGENHHNYGKKMSDEMKKILKESNPSRMKGKKHSQEAKEKIGKGAKGRAVSKETRTKLRKANIGKTMSEESKKKMSYAKKGICGKDHNRYEKKHSEETKRKISKANSGKIRSKEIRLKMSKASTGIKNSNHKYFWITPNGHYDSAYKAGIYFKVSRKTIEQRCRKGYGGSEKWLKLGWSLIHKTDNVDMEDVS